MPYAVRQDRRFLENCNFLARQDQQRVKQHNSRWYSCFWWLLALCTYILATRSEHIVGSLYS
jgi:hypothetical protein